MTWPRSSSRTSALIAVRGQFITVRSVLWGASLSAIAVFLALNIGIRVGTGIIVASLCVALLGAASTISRTWIGTQKWRILRAFPIEEATLVRQTVLVAAGVLTLDVACPIILFSVFSADSPDAEKTWCTVLFGMGAAVVSVLSRSASRAVVRLAMLLGLIVSAALWIIRDGIGTLLVLVLGAVGLAAVHDVGALHGTARHATADPNILLGELRSSTMTLVDSIGLAVMSAIFTFTTADQGLITPLGMAFVTANTPLNSFFSRNPSTYSVIVAAPGSNAVFARYYSSACVFYVLSGIPAAIMLSRSGVPLPILLAELISCAAAAALVAGTLERYRPITSWKSEREVLRHPRKYLPPAAGLAATTLVMLVGSPA